MPTNSEKKANPKQIIMPKWFEEFRGMIQQNIPVKSRNEGHTIESLITEPPINSEDPKLSVAATVVTAQVALLQRLHDEGKLK